jgi:hypothetical protein
MSLFARTLERDHTLKTLEHLFGGYEKHVFM